MQIRTLGFRCVLGAVAPAGCIPDHAPKISEPMMLSGIEVDVDTLNRGREAYTLYCYACHGIEGDGNGPAAYGLRPPPRNFAQATFKFTGVTEGLPHDDDLKRVIKYGLDGTPMLAWDIPDGTLDDIIQYIKTFSPEDEGFRDPDAEIGTRVIPGADPWKGREEEAVARGNEVYHGQATCWSCHPAYAPRHEIATAVFAFSRTKTRIFRDNLYRPELKESQYTVPGNDGEDYAVRLLPPDFTLHDMRSARSVGDLFRTLGSGIGGTAMPAWSGSLPDDDIWAMAHYVRHLSGWKGTSKVAELKNRLEADRTPIRFPDETDHSKDTPGSAGGAS